MTYLPRLLRVSFVSFCVAVGVGLTLWSAVAQAQEGDPQRARQLYDEARQLNDDGQVRESLGKLREAYEAFPSDAILLSIANRYLDLGEPEEAAEELAKITGGSAKMKAQVRRLQTAIDASLAEPVAIRVTADAESATLSVDGAPFRTLPARIELPRGSHTFVVRAPSRNDVEFTRVLKGSVEYPLIVKMQLSAGRFRIAIDPPEKLDTIRVLLNGQQLRLSKDERQRPVTDLREIAPGQYTINCLKGFDERADATLNVKAGQVTVATCTYAAAPEEGGGISPWAWVTGGTALAAMGAGAGVLIQHYVELPDLKKQYPAPRYRIRSSKPAVGATLLATGGALAVVSALFFADVF